MKFTLLDSRVVDSNQHDDDDDKYNKHQKDKYQYLDDLLDKTFLVDYFLVHDVTGSSTSNK
jgi:hypothetical protein